MPGSKAHFLTSFSAEPKPREISYCLCYIARLECGQAQSRDGEAQSSSLWNFHVKMNVARAFVELSAGSVSLQRIVELKLANARSAG